MELGGHLLRASLKLLYLDKNTYKKLLKNYSINFTPGKEIYVCEDCARTVMSIDVKRGALDEAEEKFRKVRRPSSYIAAKLDTTPSRRGTAKRP